MLRYDAVNKTGSSVMMSVIRSGLDAAIQNLDVTSNNIANARTTGYKKQQATFTDMYGTKIATVTGDPIGNWRANARNRAQARSRVVYRSLIV